MLSKDGIEGKMAFLVITPFRKNKTSSFSSAILKFRSRPVPSAKRVNKRRGSSHDAMTQTPATKMMASDFHVDAYFTGSDKRRRLWFSGLVVQISNAVDAKGGATNKFWLDDGKKSGFVGLNH